MFGKYFAKFGEIPRRVALLGGISHTVSDRKQLVESVYTLRSFRGDERAELDAFDPEVLWLYPSFARELIRDRLWRCRT